MTSLSVEYSEYKWRCRRGMLELDILLNSYLDKNYKTMTREQGAAFDEILDYPDQVLLDLLMGNMQSSDQSVNMIVKRIREAVTN